MMEQALTVLDHNRRQEPSARGVHFNFMARGEPLANWALLSDADGLLEELSRSAVALGLRPRHLISTIYPRVAGNRPLEETFVTHHPGIHYSLYSMSDAARPHLPARLPLQHRRSVTMACRCGAVTSNPTPRSCSAIRR